MSDDALFAEVIADHEADVRVRREGKSLGWWVGLFGLAVGVLGMAGALAAMIYLEPKDRYHDIDNNLGVVRESIGATDAPEHFGERVIKRAITEYIDVCTRYIWQLDAEADRRCKLMSSPEQKRRYVAWREQQDFGGKYGGAGGDGYTKPLRYLDFRKRGEGADKTLEYDVFFIRGEVLQHSGAATEHRDTAHLIFSFHPEVSMAEADRLRNEVGMYVTSFSSGDDN